MLEGLGGVPGCSKLITPLFFHSRSLMVYKIRLLKSVRSL